MGTKIERYDIPRRTVWSKGEKPVFDLIVSTISPDQPFDNCYEEKGRGNAVRFGISLAPIGLLAAHGAMLRG